MCVGGYSEREELSQAADLIDLSISLSDSGFYSVSVLYYMIARERNSLTVMCKLRSDLCDEISHG